MLRYVMLCKKKIKSYRCFNGIYYTAKHAGTELVCTQLLKSICVCVVLNNNC